MSWIKGIAGEIKAVDASNSKIRQFGWLWFVVFILVQTYISYPFDGFAFNLQSLVWLLIGSLILSISYLVPLLLRPVYYAWMGLAVVLGAIVNVLIISIVFYLVITPIGFFVRLSKGEIISVKQRKADSYWMVRDSRSGDLTKQF
jgi:hypothetical protein